jgi:DUF1707 SHOCT-like domain
MSLDPTADSSLRTSDTEREHVVAALGLHLSVGRLTMSESENRLDTAYAARTRRELDAVLADLPTTPPQPAPRSPHRQPRAIRSTSGRSGWWAPGVRCSWRRRNHPHPIADPATLVNGGAPRR